MIKNFLLFSAALPFILFAQGCYGRFIETGCTFTINEPNKTIYICKAGYINKFITAEGFFPDHKDSATLFYETDLDKSQNISLVIGRNFRSQYNQFENGHIELNFNENSAQVSMLPTKDYYWLDLNGTYKIVFEK